MLTYNMRIPQKVGRLVLEPAEYLMARINARSVL
jgi:hypothetical protein